MQLKASTAWSDGIRDGKGTITTGSKGLRAAGTVCVIEPHVRSRSQPGGQATKFLVDPSGNALEFRAFQDIAGPRFAR